MEEVKHESASNPTIKWTKLEEFPYKLHSNFIMINKHGFIGLPDHYPNQPKNSKAQQSDGIYKYNSKTNKWTLYIKYPDYITMALDAVAIDHKTNVLYAHNKASKVDAVVVFDLGKKRIKRKRKKQNTEDINTPIGAGSSGIVINNAYNIVYGRRNRHHLVFVDDEFKISHSWTKWKKGNIDHGLLHIKSQNILLLFGGKRLTPKNKQKSTDTDSIWKYSIENTKWIKLKEKLPYKCSDFGYILSNDEKYIILFGAKDQNIDILDLSTMKWHLSFVTMPIDAPCYAIINDRNYIHLITKKGGDHWEIKLEHILQIKNGNKSGLKNDLQIGDSSNSWNYLKCINYKNMEIEVLKTSEKKLKSLNIKLLNEKKEMEQKYIRLQKSTNYILWTVNDVYEWMINIDNGRYNKYCNILRVNLRKENINGECLEVINEMDLQRIGVTDFRDKKLLKKQIDGLITYNKQRDDSLPICKICYNDPMNYVVEPCHHLYCKQCAVKFKECPKCKTPIKSSFQVYD